MASASERTATFRSASRRLTLAAFVAAVQTAGAQNLSYASVPLPPLYCDDPVPGTGTITGRLIADTMPVSVTRGVGTGRCIVRADASGRYFLRGLPAGEYEVFVGTLGIRGVPRVRVRVGPDSTTTLDFHLRPAHLVNECLEIPTCGPLLAPLPPDSSLTDAEQLLVEALWTTMGIASLGDPLTGPITCVAGPNSAFTPAVLAVLRHRAPATRPSDACEWNGSDRSARLVEKGTGAPAWRVGVNTVTITGSTATSTSSDQLHRYDGGVFQCTYERLASGWRPVQCVLTRIS